MEDELIDEVDETTDQAGSLDETNEELENEADETATQSSDEETNEIDYEAELLKERKRRENAEKKIVELKREAKNEDEEDPDELINRRIDERVSLALRDSSADTVESELLDITANDKERELIKYHYENSIKQSGYNKVSIRQDLERARLIANESKILKETSELREALKSKATIGRGQSNNQDRKVVEDRKFSKADLAFMKARGIKLEDVKSN